MIIYLELFGDDFEIKSSIVKIYNYKFVKISNFRFASLKLLNVYKQWL